jgi:hypothetical protein
LPPRGFASPRLLCFMPSTLLQRFVAIAYVDEDQKMPGSAQM